MYLGRDEIEANSGDSSINSDHNGLSDGMGASTPQNPYFRESSDPNRVSTNRQFPPIKTVVLLGGLVRPTQLSGAIGRSLMDLPTGNSSTLVSHWHEQVEALAIAGGIEKLTIRVVIDKKSPLPRLVNGTSRVSMRVDQDQVSFRGTGGVLHDIAKDYEDEDYLLVGNAAQMLLEPLPALVGRLAEQDKDIVIVSHADGTPSGLALVRCGALRDISPIGFVDFKEQALPAIARTRGVGVVNCTTASGVPIRTPVDYIHALLAASRNLKSCAVRAAEDWRVSFGISESGADVDPSARIHDSVVLDGAQVQRGAVLVRAVVCPGATVKRGQTVVDRLVTKDSVHNSQV